MRLLREAAALIASGCYEFAAVDSLEVGKNRMEALGDVQETADLIAYYCDQMERNDGFVPPMGERPAQGLHRHQPSVLRPYGVWVVISPLQLPGGAGGRARRAPRWWRATRVVFKPATDTPVDRRTSWRDCFLDAGLPEGVFNFVTGPGAHAAARS